MDKGLVARQGTHDRVVGLGWMNKVLSQICCYTILLKHSKGIILLIHFINNQNQHMEEKYIHCWFISDTISLVLNASIKYYCESIAHGFEAKRTSYDNFRVHPFETYIFYKNIYYAPKSLSKDYNFSDKFILYKWMDSGRRVLISSLSTDCKLHKTHEQVDKKVSTRTSNNISFPHA